MNFTLIRISTYKTPGPYRIQIQIPSFQTWNLIFVFCKIIENIIIGP